MGTVNGRRFNFILKSVYRVKFQESDSQTALLKSKKTNYNIHLNKTKLYVLIKEGKSGGNEYHFTENIREFFLK